MLPQQIIGTFYLIVAWFDSYFHKLFKHVSRTENCLQIHFKTLIITQSTKMDQARALAWGGLRTNHTDSTNMHMPPRGARSVHRRPEDYLNSKSYMTVSLRLCPLPGRSSLPEFPEFALLRGDGWQGQPSAGGRLSTSRVRHSCHDAMSGGLRNESVSLRTLQGRIRVGRK